MARSLTTTKSAKELLTDRPRWIVFDQIRRLVGDASRGHRASLLLSDLDELLTEDEQNRALGDGLVALTRRAEELLRITPTPPPPPEPGWATVLEKSVRVDDPARLSESLRALTSEVESAAGGAGELRVEVTVVVTRREIQR
jgi:hypothetical protein